MRTNLAAYGRFQVFLNYPYDDEFELLSHAMHFAVVAARLLPVCGKDLSAPDRPRLEMLVDAIFHTHYSVHDFSKGSGEGENNFARFNMPIEMGMALFHTFRTQREAHRCAFFVPAPHDYKAFASDLAGLDTRCYENDDVLLVAHVYEWLRSVVKEQLFNQQPTIEVKEKYKQFKILLDKVKGSDKNNHPTHDEAQELMFKICSECGWWEWRTTKVGKSEFPSIPLSFKG
jgi:hypothetical protein